MPEAATVYMLKWYKRGSGSVDGENVYFDWEYLLVLPKSVSER